jgi:hypothetical protein
MYYKFKEKKDMCRVNHIRREEMKYNNNGMMAQSAG